MKATILTVGAASERVDRLLTQELTACAIEIAAHLCAADAGTALQQTLIDALRTSDLVLVCGGMTDGAAQTITQVLGLPPESNELPGTAPRGATVFVNEHGNAPGFAVEKYGQAVLLLPATLHELAPMLQQGVTPYLAQKSGSALFSHTIGVFGLSEVAVTKRLSDLLADSNPAVTLFSRSGGEILLRVTARAADADRARDLCEPVADEIRERLGAFVYGVDVGSLQMAVVRLLTEKNMKIATAESCTAGLLSGKLTQVSGASAVFECGVAAYSKEIKRDVLGVPEAIMDEQGTVCADTAAGMATGARQVGGSHIGIGITGEAGPLPSEDKPVGTVFIALADNRRVWVKEIHATAPDRDTVREIATCQALDLTRRYLEALPAVMAGGQLLDEAAPSTDIIPKAAPTKHPRLLSSIFPWKGDTRVALVTKSLLWAGVAAILVALAVLLNIYVFAPARNREQYVSLELLYTQDPTTSGYSAADFPDGMLARFYALYNQNPDIKGWVRIEDTNISYPVVQNSALDYSALNFERAPSEYGVPYFDQNIAMASPASVNRSFIIHGNNTGDGQMFSDLLSYTDASFLLNHPTVEMNTIYATGTFEVFAVLYVDENDPDEFDYRTVAFDNDEAFLTFTTELQERSLFTTSVEVRGDDTLLLLTTDASSLVQVDGMRLVVAARLLPVGETGGENFVISYNSNVLLPDALTSDATSSGSIATVPSQYQSSDDLPDIDLPTETTQPVDVIPTTTGGSTTGVTTTTVSSNTTGSTTVGSTTATTGASSTDKAEGTVGESAFYKTLTVKIGSGMASPIRTREELQYAVACAVKAEMGSARSMVNSTEAQRAQAVASYTYMLYTCKNGGVFFIPTALDLTSATDQKIYDAVGEVLGVKMVDVSKTAIADMPLCAMYFSSSNGATASSQNVYTAALPYLQSVVSVYDTEEMVRKYSGQNDSLTSTYATTWTELKAALDDYVRTATGGAVTEVSLETGGDTPLYAKTYDAAGGYVVQTNAYYIHGGRTVYLRGIDIRKAIGSNTLRSHSFTLAYDEESDELTFTVKGHGHGLGLSQYGAIAYANEAGWSWRQILTHYYSLSDTGNYRIVEPVWD